MEEKQGPQKEMFSNELHIELPAMVESLGDLQGKKILDLGCGNGNHLWYYLKAGAEVHGLDKSQPRIDLARKRVVGAIFTVADMNEALPFEDGSFDFVVSSQSVHFVENLNGLLGEVNRILRSQGKFAFSIPNPVLSSGLRQYKGEDFTLLVGIAGRDGDVRYYGDYFDEGQRDYQISSQISVKVYHRTYQTYLKTLLNSGLSLVDYVDCKPIAEAKRIDGNEYAKWNRFPSFSLFVLKKD
ncbi:MAG: class I SAM-dependent methyltransferase [Nanobdellota archaeon]